MLNRGKGASYNIQTSEITPTGSPNRKQKETEIASLIPICSKPMERNRLA